jgi:RHS repeat-associated protein
MFDGLGSERTVTNSSQTVTGTINHDAFGLTVNTTGSSTNPYKFAATSGYRDDGDAGLVLVGARYYDPQVGLFNTRDTFLDQKPYLYCEHDPVNYTDPTGHGQTPSSIEAIGKAVGEGGLKAGGIGFIGYVVGGIGDVTDNRHLSHAGQVIGDLATIGGGLVIAAGAVAAGPALVGVGLVTIGGVFAAKHLADWLGGR